MADRGGATAEERRSRDGRARAEPEESQGGPGPVPALAAEPAPRARETPGRFAGRPPGKKPWMTREGAPAWCGGIGLGEGIMIAQRSKVCGTILGCPT